VSLPTSSSQHSCLLNLLSFPVHSCFSNYILLHLIFSHFYFNISACASNLFSTFLPLKLLSWHMWFWV
jgi:hypothetical protein